MSIPEAKNIVLGPNSGRKLDYVLNDDERIDFDSRFDGSEEENGCWLWTSTRLNRGTSYGLFRLRRRRELAHRVSYLIHRGPIPEGFTVLHNCPCGDNPGCVNPSHLWLGTQKDNVRDMLHKQRHSPQCGDRNGSRLHPELLVRGERHHRAKLNEEFVREIRRIYASRVSKYGLCKKISAMFGVNVETIRCIVRRKTWTHI